MASSHRILLTGANGFVASHILSQLLAAPAKHSVRAVVRSPAKVDAIKSFFANTPSSQLDFAVVPDITVSGAFDSALAADNGAFDVVLHTASPYVYGQVKSASEFLSPAVKGTTEILHGIQRVAPDSVKKVIVTSSYAAIGLFGAADDSNKVYTQDDWNPITIEKAEEIFSQGNERPAYQASKKFAEKSAWDFKKSGDNHVKWDLVVLNPPMIYGPMANKPSTEKDLNESNARIFHGFFKGKKPEDGLLDDGLPLYVDVRDIALAHVRAIDAPEAANKRILICGGDLRSQEISDILRQEIPGADRIVPKGEPGKNTKPATAFSMDVSNAEKELGMTWKSKQETFRDLGNQLMDVLKAGGA